MNPGSDANQIRGIDILKHWQTQYFELNDNYIWRFLREVDELSLTAYSEEQISRAFSQTSKLKEAKQLLDAQVSWATKPDPRLTYEQAIEEISKPSFNLESEASLAGSFSEDSYGSISADNLATQAYSSNYLDSISDDGLYSDNGLVSEDEILSGFQRKSEDESVPEEQLDYVQFIRETNNAYKEGDS